jgi:hypothetical protein
MLPSVAVIFWSCRYYVGLDFHSVSMEAKKTAPLNYINYIKGEVPVLD